ncbi:MAG: GIY-YIG nuclease family protein [Nitrospirae bacterium]|nr:GIY-YIG nuclease family protein [Nitrospirota bacterium]
MTSTTLPEPLQCPDSWKYPKEWQDQYEQKHGYDYLSKVCKHSHAGQEILFFISYLGEVALTKIKTQNLFIKRFAAGTTKPTEVDIRDIDWPGSTVSWAGIHSTWETLFEIYNAQKAPADILTILDEIKAFMNAGHLHCQSLLQYIAQVREALAKQKETEREQAELQILQQRRTSKWERIDVEHSKVNEGFIYLLSNGLMPGIYKIGFTAGNPDKRATEVSLQYGLPMPFEVIGYWRTKDPYIIEQRIHSALAGYEKAGEFFEVDLRLAKETIEAHILDA